MKLKIAVAGMVLLVGSLALSMKGQANVVPNFSGGGNPEPPCVPPRCPYQLPAVKISFDSSAHRLWPTKRYSHRLVSKTSFGGGGNPEPICVPPRCLPTGPAVNQ
jgi:hypothetical protein